jgi:hypothetical protein
MLNIFGILFFCGRFGVSSSDAQKVLSSYQPFYKPLSHYYIICDLLERKLGADFDQVSFAFLRWYFFFTLFSFLVFSAIGPNVISFTYFSFISTN